jgi:hypothetical protein
VVGAALAENAGNIARWEARGRDRGNLPLRYDADGDDWYVLTAYPEEERD